MKKSNQALRKWEIAALFALGISLLLGLWAQREQGALSDKLIRLHVIAESDSAEDQTLKLAVRDKVLELLTPAVRDAAGVSGASEEVSARLSEVAEAAEEVCVEYGYPYRVTATLSEEFYPTRRYDGFALPAGKYTSIRVVIGEGRGKNWWCVMFPPLCMSAAEIEPCRETGLTDEDISLITEDGEGYVIKFQILDVWGKILKLLSSAEELPNR